MNEPLDLTFAALADPTRRAILLRLAKGEANVSELAKPFQMSQPAISKHLKVLEDAGLVRVGQDGRSRPRRLEKKGFEQAGEFIGQMANFWPERFERLGAFLEATTTEGAGE